MKMKSNFPQAERSCGHLSVPSLPSLVMLMLINAVLRIVMLSDAVQVGVVRDGEAGHPGGDHCQWGDQPRQCGHPHPAH